MAELNDEAKTAIKSLPNYNNSHGDIITIEEPVPCMQKGKKMFWVYTVVYEDGSTADYILKCPSIPLGNCNFLLECLNDLRLQEPQGKLTEVSGRDETLGKITSLLTHRGEQESIPLWETFMRGISTRISE